MMQEPRSPLWTGIFPRRGLDTIGHLIFLVVAVATINTPTMVSELLESDGMTVTIIF